MTARDPSGRAGLWLSITVTEHLPGRSFLSLVFTPGGDANARVRRDGTVVPVDVTNPSRDRTAPNSSPDVRGRRRFLRLPTTAGAPVQVVEPARLHDPREPSAAWLSLDTPLRCGVDLGDLPDGRYRVSFEPVAADFTLPPGPDDWTPWNTHRAAAADGRDRIPRPKRKVLRSSSDPVFSQERLEAVARELVTLGPSWLATLHCRCQSIQVSTVAGRFPAPGRVVLGVDRLTPAVRAAVKHRFGDAVYVYVDDAVGVQE